MSSAEHTEKQTQINATAQRSKGDAQKTPDMQNEMKCCRRWWCKTDADLLQTRGSCFTRRSVKESVSPQHITQTHIIIINTNAFPKRFPNAGKLMCYKSQSTRNILKTVQHKDVGEYKSLCDTIKSSLTLWQSPPMTQESWKPALSQKRWWQTRRTVRTQTSKHPAHSL